jgi:hypothetical protein
MASIRQSLENNWNWQVFVDIANMAKLDSMNKWLIRTFDDCQWAWRLMSKTNEFCPLFRNKEMLSYFY